MLKLFHLGLALIASIGMISTATPLPAQAIGNDSENRSTDMAQTIAGLAILGGGAAVIVYSAKQGNYLPQIANRSTNLQQTNQADPRLQKKLLQLLHNDRNTANRLLSHVKSTHPDQSQNWIIEKVIYDLERDRNRH